MFDFSGRAGHLRHTIAFDLSRMFIGAAGNTPRGIDRVDMGYATRLFAEPHGRHIGLVPSPGRMGALTATEARHMASLVEAHWREAKPPDSDAALAALRRWLAGEAPVAGGAAARRPVRPHGATATRYGGMLLRTRMALLRAAASAVPERAIYVNTGQVLLGWGWFFGWLDRRPDVKAVMMLHDLIPVLHPEYSGPVLSRHHGRALRTVARRAAALIATSHASADEIREALARLGRPDMPIHVVPLPVSDSLLRAEPGRASLPDVPYFVTLGTIDQRKNHFLLLHLWREMARLNLRPLPKLVIVGSRGLRTEGIHDLIARSPGLSEAVGVVSGLSSPALRETVRGARALLMPSFTEGFGLPIIEALALGTPVIASDIPAHREVGGTAATYLDPLDGLGWMGEVMRRGAGDAASLARGGGPAPSAPQSWASYFDDVLPFIDGL